MNKPKVRVIDSYDSFNIVLDYPDGSHKHYHIDQEDTRELLVTLFSDLDFDTEYEEDY